MSRIDTLKEQFPELNMSLIDIFQLMDPTKSNKYLQLFCKLFSKDYKPNFTKDSYSFESLSRSVEAMGIDTKKISYSQMCVIRHFLGERHHSSTFEELTKFIDYNERGLIEKNDIGQYSSFEDIRCAVSLISFREIEKEMEKQVVKLHEDDIWIALLPLTFEASSKYGAGTRWCTTYQREKNYFAKYWNRGILVYFINKKTGYKFAAFKALDDKELSFWNAADARTDYLDLEIDDYMFPIVKKILKSEKTNSQYLDVEMRKKVCEECGVIYAEPLYRLEEYYNLGDPQPVAVMEEPARQIVQFVDNEVMNRMREISVYTRDNEPTPDIPVVNVPTMSA